MVSDKKVSKKVMIFLTVYSVFILEIGVLLYAGVYKYDNPVVLALMGVFVISAFVTPFAFFRTWNVEEN